jgi:hypothetical protein
MNAKELAQLISLYESELIEEAQTLALFQELIDTGMAWQLDIAYTIQARDLLKEGKIAWK